MPRRRTIHYGVFARARTDRSKPPSAPDRSTHLVFQLVGAAGAVALLLGITSGSAQKQSSVLGSGRIAVAAHDKRPLPSRRSTRLRIATGNRYEISRLVRLGLPLYCGGDRGRLVALTFDDGPGPYTRLALRILRHDHAGATFFLVGRNLAGSLALVRQERALGALGDHTWTHAFLPRLIDKEIRNEVRRTQEAIRRVTQAAVDLFRPPYGAFNSAVETAARRNGMLVVLWSVDSRDAEGASWRQIAASVEGQSRPGAIILMHENHGQTIRALKSSILPWLRRHRFRPVSIPYLLAHDPPTKGQLESGQRGCTFS